MTLDTVITTLDTFRDEYNNSTEPDIVQLCGFLTNTITTLETYKNKFVVRKTCIEKSQQYYEGAITDINSILGVTN